MVTVALVSLNIPPPKIAVLPERVELSMRAVDPSLYIPPPLLTAVLPDTITSFRLNLPPLTTCIPPPLAVVSPPVTVRF